MGMMNNIVQLQQVYFKIKHRTILNNIDCSIGEGQAIAIIGANGSGKSTLLRILSGLLTPTSGKLIISQLGYASATQAIELKQIIGYAPDKPPLYMHDTIENYLQFVARLKKIPNQFVPQCVTRCLKMLDLITLRDQYIYKLSKGMQQRVNLAQALIHNPQLLILDEPTNGLDNDQCENFAALLKKLKAQNVTIIFASHHYSELISICDFMLKLDAGKMEKIMLPLETRIEDRHELFNHAT